MVDNGRSIFRNTGFSLVGRGIGDLSTFLFLVIFARSFGSQTLGEFSVAMAIGGIVAALLLPGFGTLLVREVARNPADGPRLVGAVAGLQLPVAGCLFAGLALSAGLFAEGQRARQILLIMGAYQLLYTLGMAYRHYFRAREQAQFSAGLEAAHKVLILLGGLSLIAVVPRAEVALLVYPVAALCMYAGGYALLRVRHSAPRTHIDPDLSRRWFLASLPLFMTSILAVIEMRGGIIYLGSIGDSSAVGLYAAGERLLAAAALPFLMFNGALFPVMSRLGASTPELTRLLTHCQRLAFTLALPLATAILLLRQVIVDVFFGADFAAASQVLGILAMGLVATAVFGPANALMLAQHRLKAVLGIQLLGLGCYFAAMALLIPDLGFVGLAWAALLHKTVCSLAALIYLQRRGYAMPGWPIVRAPLAAAIGMAGVFLLAGALPLTARLVLMTMTAAILLVACGGVDRRDFSYLRQLLRPAR